MARKLFGTALSAAMYAAVLAISLGVLILGIQLAFESHWIVGLAVAFSGVLGCRVTGKAICRWGRGADSEDADFG